MSHPPAEAHEDEDPQIDEEDVIDVIEDEGDEPMDDEEDAPYDGPYDGEIVIGGPADDEMDGEVAHEDNSWHSTSTSP